MPATRLTQEPSVVAAGGFSSNKEMVAKYCPKCTGMASSNQPGATGEGMLLAEQVGAELIHMDQVQIHPSLGANTNILVTEASRGAGAIMVNREGKRFIDELTTRDLASAAILEQTGKTVFLVFDGGVRKRLKTFEGLFHLGLGKEAPTLEGLAKVLGVDPAGLSHDDRELQQIPAEQERSGVQAKQHGAPAHGVALLFDRDLAGRPLHDGRNRHQRESAGASRRAASPFLASTPPAK